MASKTGLLASIKALDHKGVEQALREKPALLQHRDKLGRNWLHALCSVDAKQLGVRPPRAIKVAELLLDAGLDMNAAAFEEGKFRATPLWHAVAKGRNWTLAKYLLARGADPEHCLWAAAWWEDLPVIELLLRRGAAIDPVQDDETPLLHALKNGRYKAARLLLDRGANVDHQDSRGMTALHHMLARQVDARHIGLVMKYDPRGDLTDRQGRSVRALMARKRDPAVKKLAVKFDV